MDFRKIDGRVNRKGVKGVLRVVGGQQLKGIRSFYKDVSASAHVNKDE